MPVVDASVCVALFKADEPGHAASRSWIEQARRANEVIAAPVIVLAELAAALSRGMSDPELAASAVAFVREEPIFQLHPVSEGMAARAAAIASRQRIRGCDSVYVALAERLGTTLVTFDGQQLERGGAVVPVQAP